MKTKSAGKRFIIVDTGLDTRRGTETAYGRRAIPCALQQVRVRVRAACHMFASVAGEGRGNELAVARRPETVSDKSRARFSQNAWAAQTTSTALITRSDGDGKTGPGEKRKTFDVRSTGGTVRIIHNSNRNRLASRHDDDDDDFS